MTLLVTGAAGFVGQAIVRRLAETAQEDVRLVDVTPPADLPTGRFEVLTGDLLDPDVRARAVQGVDKIVHLVSLPGASAERDVALSRRINLDMTMALAEALAEQARDGARPRFVFASSIAVLGGFHGAVDDNAQPAPSISYGAHKWMAEIGLSDLHRRGQIQTLSLRLPGVVARPRGATGLKSAFMSDVFHAAKAGEPFTFPVSREATFWLMSADRAARNLLHALDLPALDGRSLTLPALRCSAAKLAAALFSSLEAVRYEPDPLTDQVFGRYPDLSADAAEALGFRDDLDLPGLIEAVWTSL